MPNSTVQQYLVSTTKKTKVKTTNKYRIQNSPKIRLVSDAAPPFDDNGNKRCPRLHVGHESFTVSHVPKVNEVYVVIPYTRDTRK